MTQNLIKWVKTTAVKYAALEIKDANALYFLEDTGEIYKGAISFTDSVVELGKGIDFPASGALGKLYLHESGVVKAWDGSKWNIINPGFSTTLTDDETVQIPVSGEAIKSYVADKFQDAATGNFVDGITYDKVTRAIKYTKLGSSTPTAVPVEGFLTNATYDAEHGLLSFALAGGEAVSINLPKDNFVSNGTYNSETKEIILTLTQGGEVKIPAADLVDTYTTQNTNSVNMSVTANAFKADVNVSATAGNGLSVKADGLFVAATDISGKLDKVVGNKAGELVRAKADGQVETSGVKVGGATLAETPNATTVATEAAVNAVKVEVTNIANGKLAKGAVIPTDKLSGEGAIAPDDAHVFSAAATNKVVGDAVTAESNKLKNSLIAKTDISTVIPETGAVDTKVASEKAVADVKTGLTTTIAEKVAKTDVSVAIPETGAVDTKVASEKAVATVRDEILTALSWNIL